MTAFDYRAAFALGHSYARYVTDCLIDVGVHADLQPLEYAKDEADRRRFTLHEKDVVTLAGVLEVKSSSRVFGNNPDDYPASTLIVDTYHGFHSKVRKPIAYCMVSQETKAIVVVPVSSQPSWCVQNLYDKHRKIYDDFLIADKRVLRSFEDLVEWLRGKHS